MVDAANIDACENLNVVLFMRMSPLKVPDAQRAYRWRVFSNYSCVARAPLRGTAPPLLLLLREMLRLQRCTCQLILIFGYLNGNGVNRRR
jgi:hypothetical protein